MAHDSPIEMVTMHANHLCNVAKTSGDKQRKIMAKLMADRGGRASGARRGEHPAPVPTAPRVGPADADNSGTSDLPRIDEPHQPLSLH